jgi:deoxycytidylate deaminase
VLGLGTNEVPKGDGGQYKEFAPADGRDHVWPKRDSSDAMKDDILDEILDALEPAWKEASLDQRAPIIAEWRRRLKSSRIMNLTEFGRAVHAEMEAILSAGRMSISVRGATLYTTTFPCHNCTKHIVDAGIARVVFIEPYPKSLARALHADAIELVGEEDEDEAQRVRHFTRVPFVPFVGIGPRRYSDLFTMSTPDGRRIRRKDETGVPVNTPAGLRLQIRKDSYLDRERIIAETAITLTDPEPGAE